MYLLPESLPIGPLNMRVEDLALGAVAFGAAFAFIRAMVLRMNRVLQVREELSTIPEGGIYHDIYLAEQELAALRSGSRHEAARIRQDALEEGASLLVAAREDGIQERDRILASGQARIEADRAAAEAELRLHVAELASELAARIVGEPIPAGAGHGDARYNP
ncbi:F0F1 ATP synthase subunit B family protein [Streptomyces sp. NBC_01304]|uniref:F0F1 ATP synthase subunit B family protein n=1 Tax=Streptomyces sp. NBC_01304 TaxID=2903818 RepID=UPI002E0DA2EC|nr:hypothetical protein OG430_09350 [Streptomyces sp. NBC_01304]